MKPLPYSLLCIAAAAVSFAAGRWQYSPPSAAPATSLTAKESPPSPLQATAAKWAACWQEAGPAQRDVLLQSWMERDPRAAFQFIVRLPPGTLPAQHELERQALDGWSRREPAAAYTFAACHRSLNMADELLHNAFSRDEQSALAMLRARVDRTSCGGIPAAWINRDPAHACAMLATLPAGLKQDSTLQQAFGAWAKKDAPAAIAAALALNGTRTRTAITGIIEVLPPADAAALTLSLKDPEQTKAATWQLMVNWARKDPAAATAWAMENLPPASLAHAMSCFECNVIQTGDPFKNQKLADVLAAFTPAAWLATAECLSSGSAPFYLEGAPDWFRPRIYDKLPGKTTDLTQWAEPENAPEWFRKLPEEQAGDFIRTMARREGTRESWPSVSSIPPQWQDAAARGVLENMTGPRGVVEDKVLALPPEEKALLRAQLPNIDQSLPKLPHLRELLGE